MISTLSAPGPFRAILLNARNLTAVALAFFPVQPALADVLPGPSDARSEIQAALKEFDEALAVRAQHPDEARRRFFAVARKFEIAAASSQPNGMLEYNAGNAYLLGGDGGRAILHYRRALRLIPRDPLVAENLATARARTLTQIQPSHRLKLFSGLLFWHSRLSAVEKVWSCLAIYVLAWVLLSLRCRINARSFSIAGAVALLVAVCLGGSFLYEGWADRNTPSGVVVALDVPVHRGPSLYDARVFQQPLQPGVEFTLRERRGEWWKIELGDGHAGWIEANCAELVPVI